MEDSKSPPSETSMSATRMDGQPYGRHRLAVLPGLSSSKSPSVIGDKEYGTTLATVGEQATNRNLIPLSAANSKQRIPQLWNGTNSFTEIRSRESDGSVGAHIQAVVNRVAMLEEANKALLEEMYRLQSNVRASEFSKKETVKEEKQNQRELMETIRSSNDVISQLTSRLRIAEEKLHREKANVQNLNAHSKKLEQILLNVQRESDSQRDTQTSHVAELRHRIDDISRKWEKSDRTSENIVDEFHQLKNKVEMQAMEFAHLQSDTKQKSKRMEDEMRQSLQQGRMQKDTTSIAEQNNLQLRHLLESRLAETRDALIEMRSRITQTESDGRSQVQQLTLKLSEQQTAINDLAHKRQEELHSIEKSRQDHDHSEAGERLKLHNKIKAAVEEMSDKLLQKEVRLREEAVKKFIDVEKLLQREEAARVDFEKRLREETENRWNLQQKIYLEEMQAMKEMRRTERSKQASNQRNVEEGFNHLEKKFSNDRKALEKVLLAEITKREEQSIRVVSQIGGVQDQLRIALSSLQQAIGGLQFQVGKDKDKTLAEIKTRFAEEEKKFSLAVSDVDTRLAAITVRMTQQEETYEAKMSEFQSKVRDEHNQLVHSAAEWRETLNKDINILQDALRELPQDLRETQERLDLLKSDSETRSVMQNESRMKDHDATKKQLQQVTQRIDEHDSAAIEERSRHEKVHRDLIEAQGKIAQVERFHNDARSGLNIRLNSETKMRLEETSSIKRDLARLKVDVQPLLWQQSSQSHQFIKEPTSILNEWGIYQCARWYDIKMRWLRLLDRRKQRTVRPRPRMTSPPLTPAPIHSVKPQSPPQTPGSNDVMDPSAGNQQSPIESNNLDRNVPGSAGARPNSRDTLDDPLDVEDVIGDISEDEDKDRQPLSSAPSPQPAWYNKDRVEVDGRDERSDDVEESFREDTDPELDAVETDRSADGPEERSRSGEQPSPGSQRQSTFREQSRQSQPRSKRNTPSPAVRVAPGGSGGKRKASTTSRTRAFGSTSGGTAYDMEGRKN